MPSETVGVLSPFWILIGDGFRGTPPVVSFQLLSFTLAGCVCARVCVPRVCVLSGGSKKLGSFYPLTLKLEGSPNPVSAGPAGHL